MILESAELEPIGPMPTVANEELKQAFIVDAPLGALIGQSN